MKILNWTTRKGYSNLVKIILEKCKGRLTDDNAIIISKLSVHSKLFAFLISILYENGLNCLKELLADVNDGDFSDFNPIEMNYMGARFNLLLCCVRNDKPEHFEAILSSNLSGATLEDLHEDLIYLCKSWPPQYTAYIFKHLDNFQTQMVYTADVYQLESSLRQIRYESYENSLALLKFAYITGQAQLIESCFRETQFKKSDVIQILETKQIVLLAGTALKVEHAISTKIILDFIGEEDFKLINRNDLKKRFIQDCLILNDSQRFSVSWNFFRKLLPDDAPNDLFVQANEERATGIMKFLEPFLSDEKTFSFYLNSKDFLTNLDVKTWCLFQSFSLTYDSRGVEDRFQAIGLKMTIELFEMCWKVAMEKPTMSSWDWLFAGESTKHFYETKKVGNFLHKLLVLVCREQISSLLQLILFYFPNTNVSANKNEAFRSLLAKWINESDDYFESIEKSSRLTFHAIIKSVVCESEQERKELVELSQKGNWPLRYTQEIETLKIVQQKN